VKPLIVGLAPHRNAKVPAAFAGGGSSARRLAGLLGVDAEHLLDVVDAVNLSPEPLQSASAARWSRLANDLDLGGRVVVACGRIVSTALGGPQRWGQWARLAPIGRTPGPILATVIPHPSGLNRLWNDPATVRLGERIMVAAVCAAREFEEELCTT
jgi:uracil-DNA glycosylase